MKLFMMALLMAFACLPLVAQDRQDNKPPSPPYLKRASGPTSWTVTIKQESGGADGGTSSAASDHSPRGQVMTVTKKGKIVLEKTVGEDGATFEIWRSGDLLATSINGTPWFIGPNAGTTFNVTDYTKTDFAGFDWVSLRNYSGIRAVGGKRCLVFKDKIVTMDPQEISMMKSQFEAQPKPENKDQPFSTDSFKVDVEADIDAETRMPVLLTYKTIDGKVMTRSYAFQPAGTDFALPDEVAKLFKKTDDLHRRMAKPIAPI